jgi:hypothetical protein
MASAQVLNLRDSPGSEAIALFELDLLGKSIRGRFKSR